MPFTPLKVKSFLGVSRTSITELSSFTKTKSRKVRIIHFFADAP
jgi:hypothetical protein